MKRSRAIARRTLAFTVLAVLAATVPANAGTKSAPYDATYTDHRAVQDATGQGSSSATSTQSAATGAVSVTTSSEERLPAGTIVELYGATTGVGATQAEARAGITQTVAVSGNGSVAISFDSLATSLNATGGVYGVSGAYAGGTVEAYVVHYPCAIGASCYADDYWYGYQGLAVTYAGPASGSQALVTLTYPNTKGAGYLLVQAGLRASTRATGATSASAQVSGRVASITTP